MSNYWKAFTVPLQGTLERIISFVPRLFVAFILFLLFYGIARVTARLVRKSVDRIPRLHESIRILLVRSTNIFVLLVGCTVALSAADVNVTALLTSLGVAGFALGFAFKDILENFISGILLLFSRPFEIGDQVKLGDFEGVITDIEIRTTTLRTFSNERVEIPNSRIYTNPVINHSALGKRRYVVPFDTTLVADVAQVEQAALRITREHPEVADSPEPILRMTAIDNIKQSINWELFYWSKPTETQQKATVSDILTQLKAAVYDATDSLPAATPGIAPKANGIVPASLANGGDLASESLSNGLSHAAKS